MNTKPGGLVDDRISQIHEDVKEIRSQLVELIKLHAIANQTLIEHERRSTNLETRLKPIEDLYVFMTKATAITSGVIAVLAALYKFLH